MSIRSEQRDVWDRVTALATILLPAAIALAGYFIAHGLKEAETEQSRLFAQAHGRMAEATVIDTVMKSLASATPQQRKLAVQAALIALPDQGPVLARAVAQYDSDSTVQAAAEQMLEQRAKALIRELFSPYRQVRAGAARDLIQHWGSDPRVVESLVHHASRNKDNSNGIYHAALVLNDFSPQALQAHKKEVMVFIDSAKSTGVKTGAQAVELAKKLESPL